MTPTIIPRSGHPISRRDIDPCALKVLYRLYRSGHVAYLVGGGVRDLLLGVRPKDFDVATDAHPQRIRKLFRNCFLIGRRFRLAHVRFGSTVIEVSTFRRPPEGEKDGDLLIRRDNTFGTPEDDALRRDFTVNALFYDIGTFALIDYVGGMADVEDGCIRSIGDPDVRYQEDPVRMIRAVKFAARLGFEIVEDDVAAIRRHRQLIHQAAVPRLLEELYKLLRGGAAAASFRLLDQLGLLDALLPEVADHLGRCVDPDEPEASTFYRMLFGLDAHVTEVGPDAPSNGLLLSALLTPLLEEGVAAEGGAGTSPWTAATELVDEVLAERLLPLLRRFTVARKDVDGLTRILGLQPRLAGNRRSPQAERMPCFHDAVRVLELGAALHPELQGAARHWSRRAGELPVTRDRRPARRRRPRRSPRRS